MNRFLATTATLLVLGTSAYADNHTAVFSDMQFDSALNLNASQIIGKRIYATEAEVDTTAPLADGGEAEWDDIGEVNEIVLTRDGQVQSVIVGVGGFIGIGEKDVAIDMSQLKFVSDGEEADEYFLVVNANAAGITDAPAYGMNDDMDAAAPASDANTTAPAADMNTTAETGNTMLTAPSVTVDGYENVAREDLTAEMLTGARVYGVNDEDVGEISEVLLTAEGATDRAVIDVGGFLGLGERSVAVTMGELQIVRDENGGVRVYIDSTEEALEALPVYEG